MPYGYADSESGAIRYPTLSSLLSTAPKPGMRATALDAPGSMLYEVGGKWGGSLGSVSQVTLDALTASELEMMETGTEALVAGTRMLFSGERFRPEEFTQEYDVAIYGATFSGIVAAIAAKRAGASVVVFGQEDRIGGMTTSGIASTDISNYATTARVTGIVSEFYRRCADYYGISFYKFCNANSFKTECKVASVILSKMVQENGIHVVLDVDILSVTKNGLWIASVDTGLGVVCASQFIDASYTGDLLRLAGCSYRTDREAATEYSEEHAGVRLSPSGSAQFASIDPYIIPGDPGSGLVAGISSEPLGADGDQNDTTQALALRFSVTKSADRIAFPDPETYDASDYELLGRLAESATGLAWTGIANVFDMYQLSSAGADKYDMNTKAAISLDNFAYSNEYITATKERRKEIRDALLNYSLGLIKFLRTDSRVNAAVKADVENYGLSPDEWGDVDNLPPAVYVREGARLVGDTVTTESWFASFHPSEGSCIGFFSYYFADSHNCRRVVSGGLVKNEGLFSWVPAQGVQIPSSIIKPKASECSNLLVTCCPSVTHSAHQAIRYEPNYGVFGDAAGVFAAIAANKGVAVQDVANEDYRRGSSIYSRLYGKWFAQADNVRSSRVAVTTVNSFAEQPNPTGAICPELLESTTGAYKRFQPHLEEPTRMRVLIKFSVSKAIPKSVAAPMIVSHMDGTTNLTINQNASSGDASCGDWVCIGSWMFASGSPSGNYVDFGRATDAKWCTIQAIAFEPDA